MDIDKTRWITMMVNNETFLEPIEHVKEVIPYSKPTNVPSSPSWITGILNVRGEIIPVVSMREILDIGQTHDSPEQKVVMIESSDGLFGVTVDGVDDIVELDNTSIEFQPSASATDLIKGTVPLDKTLGIILDLTHTIQAVAEADLDI